MMLDSLGTLYELLKDVLAFILKRLKKPDPVDILEKRKKWRSEFETYFYGKKAGLIYGEAIVRDLSRMDEYPDSVDSKAGLSPWFKVEVKDLYHRGVEVILRIDSLVRVEKPNGWRFGRYDESGAINAFLVGKIPFDVIRAVEWKGDNHYRCPHIYCDFNKKHKQPYEDLVYYEAQGGLEHRYFEEIARFSDVTKISKRFRRKAIDRK